MKAIDLMIEYDVNHSSGNPFPKLYDYQQAIPSAVHQMSFCTRCGNLIRCQIIYPEVKDYIDDEGQI